MKNTKDIFKEVISRIKPTKEEEKRFSDRIEYVLKKINRRLKDATAVLGGSVIKGTWLRDVHDADIFVCFDYDKYKDKGNISNELEKALKHEFKKISKIHGSRDYFQIKEQNFTFEIIPILSIKKAEQAKNITDVSPLHARWVNKHREFRDEIRLTKQFFKAANVYGAESYIKGFSGYVCEILTIYYKSFFNLLKAAAKWKEKTIIDVKHHYRNKEVLFILNKSKIQSPLIIVDPVQKDRNAAAAVGREKFYLLIETAKKFIKNPSAKFFEKEKFWVVDLIKRARNKRLILLEIQPHSGKRDIIGCKLVKALEFIKIRFLTNDFRILEYGWNWENKNALFYFVLKRETLSKKKVWEGPPIDRKEHVNFFKKKYRNTFIKDGKIYANVDRIYLQPEDMIKSLISNDYLKDKIKCIKIKNE